MGLNRIARVVRRIRGWLRRGRIDAQLRDEIEHHIAMRRRQLEADGMDPHAALLEARRQFGNALRLREEAREMWSIRWLDATLQDVRHGARLLWRSPAFTAVAVLSLSLGIGSAAAVFNIADAVLFRPLAVRDPASLRDFRVGMSFGGTLRKEVFGGDAGQADAIQRAADFADVIGFRTVDDVGLALPGMDVQPVRGEFVSPQYFSVLGVGAAAGRLLDARDRGPSPLPVVVSERWWRTVMGADRAAPGRALVINNLPAVIVGVAEGYRGLITERPADVFLPLDSTALVEPAAAANTIVRLAIRLHPGVSTAIAEQKMAALYRSVQPPSMARAGELRLTLGDASRGVSEARRGLHQPIALGLALAGVLLIAACGNAGGLLIARFAARHTEFGVRVAIGAGRSRLVGQLFVEALLLAALAAGAGLVMAGSAAPLLAALVPSGPAPIAFDVRFDWRLVAFTGAVALAAAIVAGGISLVHVLRTDPAASLGPGSRSIAGGRRVAMDVLVGSQIGCSLLLLVITGAMGRTLINLRHVDPGFDVGTIAFTVDASGRLADSAAGPGYFSALHERVAAMPEVSRATLSQVGLLTSASTIGTVDIAGWSPAADEDRWTRLFWVGPDYFETLGMRIVAGTGLGSHEMSGRERVAVVTRQFATFYFGAPGNAVGRIVNRNLRIVGVVADGTYNTFRDRPARAMFLPFTQAPPRPMMTLLVRPAGDRSVALGRIATAIRSHDPLLKVTATSMADLAEAAVGRERFAGTVSAVLALLALFLSCAGVYATVAYAVSERRKELAVRFALGATTRDAVRLVVGHPLRVALIGMAFAVPVTYALLRAASSLLFGVPPFDAPIVAAAAIGLLGVAASAAAVPAWRVASIDPQECLRAS